MFIGNQQLLREANGWIVCCLLKALYLQACISVWCSLLHEWSAYTSWEDGWWLAKWLAALTSDRGSDCDLHHCLSRNAEELRVIHCDSVRSFENRNFLKQNLNLQQITHRKDSYSSENRIQCCCFSKLCANLKNT